MRQSKTVGAPTTPFTWDVNAGLPLLLGDGTAQYVYGPGGMLLEQVQGSTPYYYHPDRLGSVRALTDGSGTVQNSYTYDAYGNTTGGGSLANPFGYTGQYLDSESGLYYLRARYYDPATQQFLSVDPLAAFTGTPYAYAAGNPVNGVDPSGTSPMCPSCWERARKAVCNWFGWFCTDDENAQRQWAATQTSIYPSDISDWLFNKGGSIEGDVNDVTSSIENCGSNIRQTARNLLRDSKNVDVVNRLIDKFTIGSYGTAKSVPRAKDVIELRDIGSGIRVFLHRVANPDNPSGNPFWEIVGLSGKGSSAQEQQIIDAIRKLFPEK